MNSLESFEKLALLGNTLLWFRPRIINPLGITLSVKTVNKDLFTGELFYYNQDSRVLILSKPFKLRILTRIEERIHESNKYNYRYLNTEFLTEFKILEMRDINVKKILLQTSFSILSHSKLTLTSKISILRKSSDEKVALSVKTKIPKQITGNIYFKNYLPNTTVLGREKI